MHPEPGSRTNFPQTEKSQAVAEYTVTFSVATKRLFWIDSPAKNG